MIKRLIIGVKDTAAIHRGRHGRNGSWNYGVFQRTAGNYIAVYDFSSAGTVLCNSAYAATINVKKERGYSELSISR